MQDASVPRHRRATGRGITTPATGVMALATRAWVNALQDVKRDAIVFGGSFEVRADVHAGYCDRAADGLGGRECLGHRGRERAPLAAMAMLKKSHRLCQLAKGQDLDLVGKRYQAGTEQFLLAGR